MSSKSSLVLALVGCAGLLACGKVRPNQLGQAPCLQFEPDIRPLIAACTDCHGGTRPAAGYRLDDYFGATARRDDGSARLTAGDAESPFLRAARGELPNHEALPAGPVATLTDWVVRCRATPSRHRVHPNGWMTPTDVEEFHGRVLRTDGYDLGQCTSCHGADLRGGSSRVSCYTCHASGPLACSVCHGDAASSAPPEDLSGARATSSLGVGAHRQHLDDGPLHKGYGCQVCHVVPTTPEQAGHYRVDDQLDPSPAEVSITGFPGQAARWNRESATCDAYCHAPNPLDTAASRPAPTWTRVGKGEAACGSCHGIPPSTHVDNRCPACHGVAFVGGNPMAERHADGTVDLGDGKGTGCSACHGDANSPSPPRDLQGQTSEALMTVGAHRAHLEARNRLRGPIACEECHQVPATVSAPGHVDSLPPAETFPAVAAVGVLASADGATPAFDPTTGTCSTVYCHGAGSKLSRDTASSLLRTPLWTGGSSQVFCGSCHGIPPIHPSHPPNVGLTQCATCHLATISPGGDLKLTTDPVTGAISSTHLNGKVDL